MRRFGVQSLIGLAALLGPAAFGLGPRAVGGYLWVSSPCPGAESTFAAADEDAPPPSARPLPVPWSHPAWLRGDDTGGTGSSCQTNVEPTAPACLLPPGHSIPPPPGAPLRRRRGPSLSSAHLAFIFEPPRPQPPR